MTCATCAHGRKHGSWPSDHRGTHCRGCHRSWSALAQSHCMECHRHFGSNDAGDAHRRGDNCIDPKGFDRWETPTGPIWGGRSPEAMAALRARRGAGDRAEPAGKGGT